jgi:peptidoglycan/LPS O-acetylase OafA/YrhL
VALQRLIAWYKAQTTLDKNGQIAPLNGLRAVFVFSVVFFHLWQQSWLTPSVQLGSAFISFDPYLRTGYLFVDAMLLLSGFLLFLPFARARENKRMLPGFEGFYGKRARRILPSYLLHLLVIFLVVALPEKRYATWWQAARDWLAHLTFTHPWFMFSNIQTPLNGALWTLGVEVQFYLLFPLLARVFMKMPLATWSLGTGVAFLFRAYAMTKAHTPMLLNQLPAFMDVYLNGFVLAMVFARVEKQTRDDGLSRVLMSAILLAGVMGLAVMIRHQASMRELPLVRISQMRLRFPQSVMTGLIMLGACFGVGGIRLLLGNRVAGFLGAISYQAYLWHQMFALQLKKWRIPPSVNENPHMVGERAWQLGYVLLTLALTLIVSALLTYFFEQPLARKKRLKK